MSNENYVVEGTLHSKSAEITKKDFAFKEFIVNTGGKYPQYIKIQASKDKMALLDGINVGDTVTATCNVRGRMWQDTAFNSFEIYKLEKVGGSSTQQPNRVQENDTIRSITDPMPTSADNESELPF